MGWDGVIEKVWKDIGELQEEMMPAEKFGRYEAEVEKRMERRKRLELRNNVRQEERLEICGGLSEGIRRVKTTLHGPTDFAQTLEMRFRVGDLDLPERRK